MPRGADQYWPAFGVRRRLVKIAPVKQFQLAQVDTAIAWRLRVVGVDAQLLREDEESAAICGHLESASARRNSQVEVKYQLGAHSPASLWRQVRGLCLRDLQA